MEFKNQIIRNQLRKEQESLNNFIAKNKGNVQTVTCYASGKNYTKCFNPKKVLTERFLDESKTLCFANDYIAAKESICYAPGREIPNGVISQSLFLNPKKGRAIEYRQEGSNVYFGAKVDNDCYHDIDSILNLSLDGLCLYLSCVGDSTLRDYGDVILAAINNAVVSEAKIAGELTPTLYADYIGIHSVAKDLIEKSQNLSAETNKTETSRTESDETKENQTQKSDNKENSLSHQEISSNRTESFVDQENSRQMEAKNDLNDFVANHKGNVQTVTRYASGENYTRCFNPKNVLTERFLDEGKTLCFTNDYIAAKESICYAPGKEIPNAIVGQSLFLDPKKGKAIAYTQEGANVFFGANDSYHDKESILNLSLDGLCLYLSCVGDSTLRDYGDVILAAINNAVVSEARATGKLDSKLYSDYSGIYSVAKDLIEKSQDLNMETAQIDNGGIGTAQTSLEQTEVAEEDKGQGLDIESVLPQQGDISPSGESIVNQEGIPQVEGLSDLKNLVANFQEPDQGLEQ